MVLLLLDETSQSMRYYEVLQVSESLNWAKERPREPRAAREEALSWLLTADEDLDAMG